MFPTPRPHSMLAAVLCLATVAARSPAQEPWHGRTPGRWQLDEGLRIVRFEWKFAGDSGMACAVIADVRRHPARLLTAATDGGRRRPGEWLQDFELSAVINAAMFQPNGRSTALMVDGTTVNNGYDHPSYEGYLAFGAREASLQPVVLRGRDCARFDLSKLRADYTTVVQNYRLLDCDREPIEWRDQRRYAATAIGVSEDGELVLVHSGAPLRMSEFARLLASQLGLSAAVFTEGGPQAALSLRFEGHELHLGGSREAPPRSLPLVLGLR